MGLQTKGGLPVKPELSSFSLLDSDILDLLSGQPRDILSRPPDSQARFEDLQEPELIYYLYKRNYSAAYYRLKKLTRPLPPQDAMAACLCSITATNRLLETVLDHCPPIREFQFRGVGKVSSLIAVTVAHDLPEALNSLLLRGADPNLGPNEEVSPLETAFTSQFISCLWRLLEAPDLEVSLTPPMLEIWGSLQEQAENPVLKWCCQAMAQRLTGTDGGPLGPVPIPPELRLKHVLVSSNGDLAARICRERPLTDEELQDARFYFSGPGSRHFSALTDRSDAWTLSQLQSRLTFLLAFLETHPETLEEPALRSSVAETALALPEMDEALALWVERLADGPVLLRELPCLLPFSNEPLLFPGMMQHRLDPAFFPRWDQRLGSRLIPTLNRRSGPPFANLLPEDIRLLLDRVTFVGTPEPDKLSQAAQAALLNAPEEQLSRLLQPGGLLAEEPAGKLLDACQLLPANRRSVVLAHIRKETDYEL